MATSTKLLGLKEAAAFMASIGEDHYTAYKLRFLATQKKLTHYRKGKYLKIEFDKEDLIAYSKKNPSCKKIVAKS